MSRDNAVMDKYRNLIVNDQHDASWVKEAEQVIDIIRADERRNVIEHVRYKLKRAEKCYSFSQFKETCTVAAYENAIRLDDLEKILTELEAKK